MIQGLTQDQEKIMKKKHAASLIEQAPRKWVYNDSKQAVLVETEAQFDEIKGIFDLSKPNCDNSEVKVIKFGEAKKLINKAKRDIEKAKEEKKVAPKKKEEKKEA